MELPYFPSSYAGKEGFEIFLRKHIIKHNWSTETRRELFLTKRDLQDNYINFCCVFGYPIGSFVSIGKHLTFLDINVKAYVGPHGHQLPCYGDIFFSHEASDLLAYGRQLDEKEPDLSDNTDHTDCTSNSYQDTVSDTSSETSVYDDVNNKASLSNDGVPCNATYVSNNEVNSKTKSVSDEVNSKKKTVCDEKAVSSKKYQCIIEGHGVDEEITCPAYDSSQCASWNPTGNTNCDTGFRTKQDIIPVFEYVNFLEDFVTSL